MQINPVNLGKQNPLIDDYRQQKTEIMRHFDYNPFLDSTYSKRLASLSERSFDRKSLTEALITLNKKWGAPESAYVNIQRLEQDNSAVVIGGQQAGLLTGPLYTVNKIISIVQFAKQQEKRLGRPIVPVFWIAGEDHDFDEINHIYIPEQTEMRKHTIQQRVEEKRSLSDIQIDKADAEKWLYQLFGELGETNFTANLYETVQDCLQKSHTYVDFFARLIHRLFANEGLVLVDSGAPEFRKLESMHFETLINRQPEISKGVYQSLQKLKTRNYPVSLELEKDDGHLFIHHNQERILLTRNENGEWSGKQNELVLSEQELLDIARKTPALLSNNVVTRPVMQELLFPTLAFVGGPGEISYWAALKPAFNAVGIEMPPVLPRLSFTLMEKRVEKALNKYSLSAEDVIRNGAGELKTNWLRTQQDPPVQQLASEIKNTIAQVHAPLRSVAGEVRHDLGELADRNLFYLQRDIDFMEKRIVKAIEEKYTKELGEFNLAEMALHPNGGLQERTWNPISFINKYGPEFIGQLAHETCSFEHKHFIVYM
ncbi:bacillithiol biosynthesis cysteine-adding enzyme BshC [Virgibacillus siamensis]|uniref:bacillithiol biosynthesis cysteine-adding enzyme BshC n=1 Tax=Virgibacillus siamensis TaxID=480071 RepID=UPI0009845552|nr:bacillithiol biosynthesis cysteine-adding enzyme BshC [Virgibacillus siamensis]